jgi:small subunit ribosomal protein S1
MVLEVDPVKRRISLGLKQVMDNPWEAFAAKYPPAPRSRARSRTSPSSACSSASTATSTAWCICPTSTGTARREAIKDYKKGDVVKAQVLDVDARRSASASASSSWAAIRWAPGRACARAPW